MTALMPALALLLPLALAVAALTPARRWIGAALVAAPLPALVLAFAREREAVWSLPAVLTGVGFGADGLGLVFLQLTAVLWLAAGIYAAAVFRGDRALPRFAFFFLLCLAGNVGVALARDVVGFYTCFTLMSFAAYGLVVHDAGAGARRAGLTYIVLVVIGEACLVAGLLFGGALDALGFAQWPAALAAAPQRELILALLFIGLGIKAGAVPLHVWMPGAYAAAPAVAGAVLSGAMSAAGVLGWLRFFPGGETPATGWAAAFVAGGLLAAFYGVVVGVTQRDPKALLAYSSISQMGLMTLTVGLGLAEPSAWPLAAAAAGFYALHHGLAKGALFLGADLVARGGSRAAGWMAMAGLALAALSIAAAPFTAGMAAKALLKDAAYASGFWKDAVQGLLPFTSAATMLLLARFLVIVRPAAAPKTAPPRGALVAFAALVVAAMTLPWVQIASVPGAGVGAKAVWSALWPVLAGAAAGLLIGRIPRLAGAIPAGDLLVPVQTLLRRLRGAWRLVLEASLPPVREPDGRRLAELTQRWESWIERWPVAGVAVMLLIAALVLGWSLP